MSTAINDIIVTIYQAAVQKDGWKNVLKLILTAVPISKISLFMLPYEKRGLRFIESLGFGEEEISAIIEGIDKGSLNRCNEEVLNLDRLSSNILIFYRYLAEEDCVYGALFSLSDPSEFEIDQIRLIFDHLLLGFKHYLRLNYKSISASSLSRLVELSKQPVILLDSKKRIAQLNYQASMLLTQSDLCDIQLGRLHFYKEAHQRIFEKAVQRTRVNQRLHRFRYLFKGSNKSSTIFLYPLIEPHEFSERAAFAEVAVTVVTPSTTLQLDKEYMQQRFLLTGAEVRVSDLLMNGSTPKEIAVSHQVSIETVRSQLKTIFQKTNTSSQIDLMNLLFSFAFPFNSNGIPAIERRPR